MYIRTKLQRITIPLVSLTIMTSSLGALSGCASLQTSNTDQLIDSTNKGEISYIFPQGECKKLWFRNYYDDVTASFSYSDNKIIVSKVKRQDRGAKGTSYQIPLSYREADNTCIIKTKYPYHKYTTSSGNYLDTMLMSTPEFTTNSLDYFLIQNARASHDLSIQAKYKPESIYNNFVRKAEMGATRKGENIRNFKGSGTVEVNSLEVSFDLSVSPYRDGSIVEIHYVSAGFISNNQVNFAKQIKSIEERFRAIAEE